jgi:L-amino acid N-acyltransferase YncA
MTRIAKAVMSGEMALNSAQVDTDRHLASIELSTAAPSDIDGILGLQEENQPEQGGLLSARFPRAWFEAAINDLPIIVARRSERVVGFLVTASRKATQNIPVVAAMLRAYPGTLDSYVYGPVCVAADERGHGLAGMMFAELRKQLPGREAILFIRTDNIASLRAHQKMGMREVAAFEHDGVQFLALAYR